VSSSSHNSFNIEKQLSNSRVLGNESRDYLTPAEPKVPKPDVVKKVAEQQERNEIDDATRPLAELFAEQQVESQKGLSASDAAQRLARDGLNELMKPKPPSLAMLFLMQLLNVIILLLIASAVASFIVNATGPDWDKWNSYVEGTAIMGIVILNAGIAAVTENDANNALEALQAMSQPMTTVLRDGTEQKVQSNQIVRGDIVLLEVGDVCPADLRLITSDELKVNEMLLTGEPDDVAKDSVLKAKAVKTLTPATMVFSSCLVTNGKAVGVTVETGMKTRVGSIAAMLVNEQQYQCGCLPDNTDNQTPLQAALQKLGVTIGYGAIAVCVFVFAVGLYLDTRDADNPERPSWLYMVLISVTLAVAAIPEGIPLCVTISLSKGCSAMVKKNVLVRKLAAVETLGSASVICTDKTGTLTEGKMTMVQLWAGDRLYSVTGKGFDPNVGEFKHADGSNANSEALLRSTVYAGMMCSNCKVSLQKEEASGLEKWTPMGNSSEAPIVVAGGKLKMTTEAVAAANPRVLEIPFSSALKMMLTLHKTSSDSLGPGGVPLPAGSQYVAVVKGAPNFIMDACSTWTQPDGTTQPLTDATKAKIMETIDDLSSQALRVLAVAISTHPKLPYPEQNELASEEKFAILRQDLQLLGLFASMDPPRDGVATAVEDANGAHIRVVMITGDYVKTAEAIAKNIRILLPGDAAECAVDSAQLRPGGEYSMEAIDRLSRSAKVFARAQPEDKLEIVKALQRQGKVVAMTGDGVNDAPALNKADIGVAMGIQGTEVAKGASSMILTDDNFVSIVSAVEKGRVIYAGIQKFVCFIMSVHIGEVMQIFLCIVGNVPVMRTPLQILFLILVTDLPPSIALGMEPGQPGILKEYPRPKQQAIVLPWMWQGIVANGAILTVCAMLVYTYCLWNWCGTLSSTEITAMIRAEEQEFGYAYEGSTSYNLMRARTAAFVCVVWCENFRAYTSRSFDRWVCEGLLDNAAMQKAIFMAQCALYFVILTPVVRDDIMNLEGQRLGPEGWVVGISGGILCLGVCEIYKFATRAQIARFREKVKEQQIKVSEEGAVSASKPEAVGKAETSMAITL
jgi:potassium/sodium efflux P-type ATPase